MALLIAATGCAAKPNRFGRPATGFSVASHVVPTDPDFRRGRGGSHQHFRPVGDTDATFDPSGPPRDASVLPERFMDLTEAEMLTRAFANSPVLRPLGVRVVQNPDAASTIYDPAITATDPFFGPAAALSEFDAQLRANVLAQNNDRVFNNATLGGDVTQLVQDFANTTAGVSKRFATGTIVDLAAIHLYDGNNRSGNIFANYWEPQYEIGIRQPLLQGAGRTFNLIAGPNARPGFNFSNGILIARLNTAISGADFEIGVRDCVVGLYQAYWDLRQKYLEYDAALAAQNIAYQTWQTVLAKNRAAMEGGEANKEAQARAEYLQYRRLVQNTLGGSAGGNGGLYVSERRLRYLMGLPIVAPELLRPVDPPPEVRFEFDFDHSVSRAMSARTELSRQRLNLRARQLRLVAAKNFLLPQVDAIGRYRVRGFGDRLDGSGPKFASAYEDLFSFDHQEWEFGVEMGVTAGRRQARAAVRNAKLQLHRDREIFDESIRQVRGEIADAVAAVGSNYSMLDFSAQRFEASRRRLASSRALYEADKLQIEFLLDAQEELLQAQLQYAADQSRYATSIIGVGAAVGSLLADVGIHIHSTGCASQPIHSPQLSDSPELIGTPAPGINR